ncbi:MAG: repeat-containing protein [Acidimicrobiaceae bacterium]|nr:repeat-containing protein [Acidimicrobiaceae bacterium]
MGRTNAAPSLFAALLVAGGAAIVGGGGLAGGSLVRSSTGSPFLASLGKPRQVASTVPANGDVNPYGIAVVPKTVGKLIKGDALVSNFNDKANVQGTGKTIVEVSPTGVRSTFATIGPMPASKACPGGIGLTTALSILPGGWVVVGSLPAGAGGALPLANPAGCLLVLNSSGPVAETWTNQNINGPWDMTEAATSSGVDLFVSNVLSRPKGTTTTPTSGNLSTIVRIAVSLTPGQLPRMTGLTVIGTGFLSKANKAAFVQGPTGIALGGNGTLYVAGTVRNHISEIPNATTRTTAVADGAITLSSGGWLNGPLGMTIAPNGDVVVVNANDGNAVEISPQGHQVAKKTLVPNGSGDLFGATVAQGGKELLFVNDAATANALDIASAG